MARQGSAPSAAMEPDVTRCESQGEEIRAHSWALSSGQKSGGLGRAEPAPRRRGWGQKAAGDACEAQSVGAAGKALPASPPTAAALCFPHIPLLPLLLRAGGKTTPSWAPSRTLTRAEVHGAQPVLQRSLPGPGHPLTAHTQRFQPKSRPCHCRTATRMAPNCISSLLSFPNSAFPHAAVPQPQEPGSAPRRSPTTRHAVPITRLFYFSPSRPFQHQGSAEGFGCAPERFPADRNTHIIRSGQNRQPHSTVGPHSW